jgi:hypothetical protein
MGTTTLIAGKATVFDFALAGLMYSFTVSLNPSTVTVGQQTPVQVVENAFDASGEPLASGFLNGSLVVPTFNVSVSDPTATSTARGYSGIGTGPVTYIVQTQEFAPVQASLTFASASATTIGFAVYVDTKSGACSLDAYTPSGGTAVRSYGVSACSAFPHFDPNDTIWGFAPVGVNADGTSAGSFALAGSTLLAFDLTGKAYIADSAPAIDVYSGTTLVRQIDLPAFPSGAAVDSAGNVYVSFSTGGINEYGPTGSGTIPPIAMNASASGAPGVDAAGNVYALYAALSVGVWPAGTFGPSPPGRAIPLPSNGGALAVDPAGNVYTIAVPGGVYVAKAGASAFTALPVNLPTGLGQVGILAPIK